MMKRVVTALLMIVPMVGWAQVTLPDEIPGDASKKSYSSPETDQDLIYHSLSETSALYDLDTDYEIDFQACDTGRVTWSHLSAFFNAPYDGIQGFPDDGIKGYNSYTSKGRVYVRDYGGDKVLRMEVDKGNVGGPFILSTIPGKNTELYQSFNMRLKPNTNFSRGGKYVGVRSWSWPHEFSVPVDGFNNAIQFKADSLYAGSANLSYAEALSHYLTYPGMPAPSDPSQPVYGKSYGFPDTLGGDRKYFKIPNDGSWFNVTTRYVLNDIGSNNGFIEVWINNKFSHRWGGLVLRTTNNTFIDINRISFYYGGNTPEQAAVENSWVEYDDFYYFTYGDSHKDVPRGTETSEATRVLDLPNWPKSNDNGVKDDTEKPSAPQNLKTTAVSNSSVTVSWSPSSDNNAVKAYRVYVNGTRKATISNTSYEITGLSPGTEYSIQVSAIDYSYNESDKTAALKVTTTESDTTPPSVPSGLIATDLSKDYIQISWNASSDNSGIREYHVYINGSKNLSTQNTSVVISGLNPGTNYSIKVKAVDTQGNESGFSSELTVTTLNSDTGKPSAPGNVTVPDITRTSVTLSWEKANDDVGIHHYNIYVDGTLHGTAEYTQYTVGDLNSAQVYTFEISAVDFSDNESDRTSPIKVITDAPDKTPPEAPEGLSIVNLDAHIVDLVWEHAEDNDKVLGYNIYANGLKKGKTTNNYYTVNDLEAATSYNITVTAFDPSDNESLHSDILEITTPEEDSKGNGDASQADEDIPQVSIIKVVNTDLETETVTEVKSSGTAEVKEYGVRVAKDADYSKEVKMFSAAREDYYVNNTGRITANLQALYNFSAGSDTKVYDLSGNDDPMDLDIADMDHVEWMPGQGLKVTSPTLISHKSYPKRMVDSLQVTNEISLEAWVKSGDINQDGPARIVTFSSDHYHRAFTLGQVSSDDQYNYVMRFNTTNTDANGTPEGYPAVTFDQCALHHIVYTRTSEGKEILYIDGEKYYSAFRGGDFSSWDESYRFGLANEINGERSWLGSYYLLAVYNNALSAEQVQQNFQAGYGRMEFKTKFNGLNPNTTYFLSPFVKTVVGTNYGESVNIITPKSQLALDYDTLQMKIYPNPNEGVFNLYFEYTIEDVDVAWLRIIDSFGKVFYFQDLTLTDSFYRKEIPVNLSDKGLKDGVYLVTLVIGQQSITRKMIVNNNW